MAIFRGSGVALITPFKSDGGVDFGKLTELIDWHIGEGTDAFIICGSTGEASTLKDGEQIEAVRVAAAHVKGRVPVIAGAGSNDTAHGAHLCKECEKAGADALLTVTPYYNKTTQKGLIAHYGALAGAVDIPLILYNVPARTNLNILPETAAKLAKVENIRGIKEANGDTSHYMKLAALTEGNLEIYAGNDDMIVPVLSVGGFGVISTMANIAPKAVRDICALYFDGKYAEAAKLQLKSIPLIERLFCEVNPIPVKQALRFMGKYAGGYRLPLVDMGAENAEGLRVEMEKFGLI